MNCRTGNEQPDFIEDDKRIEFNQFLTDWSWFKYTITLQYG
jgi:hypothetical protein